jgi:hypothetical protein
LALVRYWLGALSRVYFEHLYFEVFFHPQIISLLFPEDKPFQLRSSIQMQITKMQISAALGQHFYVSSIIIYLKVGQNRDELTQFLYSTCVTLKRASIEDERYTTGPISDQVCLNILNIIFIEYNIEI